ncbi:unnamed protein product [Rhizopus stolonifer]
MGVCLSNEETNERVHSGNIDRTIEEENKKLEREFKMLLLGSGESGKTTIFKQMKILHQDGYTPQELDSWKLPVYRNLVQSAQAVIEALDKFEYQLDEKTQCEAQFILDHNVKEDLDPLIVKAINIVLKDPVTQKFLEEQFSGFYLMDSAPYFFKNIERISKPDYRPTYDDVLRARVKTTGIKEARMKMGAAPIHMFDVGGQRSERKKWIHCFEAVHSIIFCVSTSEYDQVLLEESRQNRLLESLVLFESVVNSRWFQSTTIILFLNKMDIFEEKITKVPLGKYFPDYGGGTDQRKAIKYILWRFQQANRAKLEIYPHLTQAINSNNIKHAFKVIRKTIIETNLRAVDIL